MGKAAGTASVGWYVAAAVSYCGAAVFEKGLLNWFVGPMWLVAFVWFGPIVSERLRAWFGRGGRSGPGPAERDDTPVGHAE